MWKRWATLGIPADHDYYALQQQAPSQLLAATSTPSPRETHEVLERVKATLAEPLTPQTEQKSWRATYFALAALGTVLLLLAFVVWYYVSV